MNNFLLPTLLAALLCANGSFAQTASAPAGGVTGSNPAVVPTPRTGMSKWLALHEKFVAQAKPGGIDLLFLGASIIEQWRTVGSNVWNQDYAPRHAADFGIGGDRTQHVLWRIEHGELDGLKPKVIVLEIGGNNGDSDPPAAIAAGIKLIVADLRAKCPGSKVLLMGITPRNQKTDKPDRMDKIGEVNRIIAGFDDGKNVRYLNINDKFLGADGKVHADIMSDFLHPTEKGYRIWADAMNPTLDALMKN
jgi:lysophospholipase L1-like esterase